MEKKPLTCLLVAINAKYIHSNLAVYSLRACAERELCRRGAVADVRVELAEYTINHRAAEILDDIYMKKADILCFSCYIWNIEYVKTLVKNLKRLCPQTPIWLGGPEVSFDCEARLSEIPEADGILYGEGERSFPALLLGFRAAAEESRSAVPFRPAGYPDGCAYRREDGGVEITPPAPFADMAELSFVYENMEEFQNRILYYETSRGCPFSCSYCLSSVDKTLRFRPMELVKRELSFFLEQQVPQVKLVDRTFNCKKSHAMEIWTFLRDHDNGVTNFHFEIAADVLDEEELSLLETMRPGLIRLEIGVQSTNERTLEAIRRKTDPEKLRRVVLRLEKKRNVCCHLDLIAGLPYEDYESFGRSFDDVYDLRPNELQLGFLKVLKGSPMYDEAGQYHILYQAEAPFEVLETPWLSHEDVIRLKQVEDMVEIYYNSRQFLHSMEALLPCFGRAFLMYEALGREYTARGMGKKKHVRAALYQFLLDFAAEHTTLNPDRFRQILTLDYYLREHAKRRPEFALPDEEYRDGIRERLFAEFPGESAGSLMRTKHVEVFLPPFTEEEEYWLFDYEARNPLTGNAQVKCLTRRKPVGKRGNDYDKYEK